MTEEEQDQQQLMDGMLYRTAELEAELAQAKAELDAWQSTCGTRQNHIEDVEKLKAEVAMAHAEFPKEYMAGLAVADRVRQMIRQKVRLETENQRLTSEHRKTYELLLCKLKDKEAENARLKAALKTIVKAWPHPLASSAPSPAMYAEQQLRDCSALRDLLAPTIELLAKGKVNCQAAGNRIVEMVSIPKEQVDEELSRLRSLTASGSGDCAGG